MYVFVCMYVCMYVCTQGVGCFKEQGHGCTHESDPSLECGCAELIAQVALLPPHVRVCACGSSITYVGVWLLTLTANHIICMQWDLSRGVGVGVSRDVGVLVG